MNCPNCGIDHWKDVDHLRYKDKDDKGEKIGMAMCTNCGFVSYPSKYKSKAEIIEHYRKEYRKPPTVLNMYTGQRKNHFHLAFLKELIEKWHREKSSPAILDIGTAFGMSLNMFQQVLPDAKLYGTELTTSYKNVCKHEFGIDLTDDFDESIKYDLIMSYKVLEHQLDPHIELQRVRKALKPDGHFYISVPTWFDSLVNFGLEGFDLNYYYEPDHINVWTRNIFENLLKRSGFEIVKMDPYMYGFSYLCKPVAVAEATEIFKEDCSEIEKKMKAAKDAFECFLDQKYDEAIAIYPDFPAAWVSAIEMKRKLLTEKGWNWFKEEVLEKALAACPYSVELMITYTDFATRAKRWEEALKMAERSLHLKPQNPGSLHLIGSAYEQAAAFTKDKKEVIALLKKAREAYLHYSKVSEQNKHDCISKIYYLSAHIPAEENLSMQ